MAVQDDIADRIAGFALFADLSAPQREQVAHQFDEAWFSEGERVQLVSSLHFAGDLSVNELRQF